MEETTPTTEDPPPRPAKNRKCCNTPMSVGHIPGCPSRGGRTPTAAGTAPNRNIRVGPLWDQAKALLREGETITQLVTRALRTEVERLECERGQQAARNPLTSPDRPLPPGAMEHGTRQPGDTARFVGPNPDPNYSITRHYDGTVTATDNACPDEWQPAHAAGTRPDGCGTCAGAR